MRIVPALTVVLLSSTAIFIAPAYSDDMLVNTLKRVSELEAKNIALELNHRRLEEDYKALEQRNRQLEKNNKAKETVIIKQEIKPVQKAALNTTKLNASTPQVVTSHKPDIAELSLITFEGAYVGLNAGYGGGDIDTAKDRYSWTTASNAGFSGPVVNIDNSSARAGGALAGGQLGYNHIFKNKFVLGAEADFDWTNIVSQSNSATTGFLPPSGAFANSSSRTGLNWLSTERIKFGYLFGSFMPYVTGGLAISQSAYKSNNYSFTSDNAIYVSSQSGGTSKVGVGWSAGAGVEYTFLNNISFKTEYLYTQTPGVRVHNTFEFIGSSFNGKLGAFEDGSTGNFGFHQIRVGLNYHPHFFDKAAPAVVAKY